MTSPVVLLKRIGKVLLQVSWYLGGQKQSLSSNISVPALGFVASEAVFVGSEKVSLGEGCMIMPGAQLICAGMPPYLEVSGRITIGAGSIVREGAILQTYGGSIDIGCSCTINPYCVIQGNGGVTIGDNVLIAAHVSIFSANHVFKDVNQPIRRQGEHKIGVVIEDDVWLGSGVRVLDGVTIGTGSVVAAGAVVNKDVAPFSVVAGVPARLIRSRRDEVMDV